MLDLAQPEFDVAGADAGRIVARLVQYLVRHVDADHAASRPDLPRGEQAIEAGAAAQVDQHLTGFQGGDRLRIAAAEAEVGAFRHRLQIGVGVAHLAGLRLLRGAAGGRGGRCTAGRTRSGGDRAVAVADQLLDFGAVHRRPLCQADWRERTVVAAGSQHGWASPRPQQFSVRVAIRPFMAA